MTEELDSLTPPEKQQAKAGAMVEAFEAGIAKVESEPAGGEMISAFAKANELAGEVGFIACSV